MLPIDLSAPSWPRGVHRLLLRACLHPDPVAAGAAWRAWRQRQNFDRIDHASLRLIPLLLRRVEELGLDDPDAGRYRGIHRRAWVRSQQLFDRLRLAVEGLAAEGIPALVLKGAALGPLFYGDTGLRPIGDADLLVPHADAARGIGWFVRQGWKTHPPADPAVLVRHHLVHDHAWAFDAGEGNGIDLHWKLLHVGTAPTLDARFWQDAVGLRLPGLAARTLSPTHHFFHACVHGVPFCTVPSFRWIADAAMILGRSSVAVDWREFLRCCDDFRVSVLAAHALTYLRRELDVLVPDEVLRRLYTATCEPWEWAEFRHVTRHPPSLHPAWLWHRHERQFALAPAASSGGRLGSYLDFLATRWDLPDRGHVPVAFIRKVALNLGSITGTWLRGLGRRLLSVRPGPGHGPSTASGG